MNSKDRLVRFQAASFGIGATLFMALAGCQPDTEIRQEKVKYPDREKLRTRVAIIEQKKFVWFFRLSGPEAKVGEHVPEFDAMVKTVRFVANRTKPALWEDPKGWTKDPPFGERYASYRIPAEPKELEVTVTKFPAKGFSLLPNVNRWQKQLDVPQTENLADLLDSGVLRKEKAKKFDITWLDFRGLGTHMVSKPGVVPVAVQKFELPVGPSRGPFRSEKPPGWNVKPARPPFLVEVYEVTDGEESAEVTLSSAGGDLAGNIDRWRGQIDLEPLKEGALKRELVEFPIGDMKAFIVDMANPDADDEAMNRIVGVIIPMGKMSWFVKMSGPNDFITRHKQEFETFVRSFRLQGQPEP